uniref:CSON001213 protein n=1 Tax=Culicoides sonorensis TaxID=179676 RepID=A0A336MHF3_CULSO
MKLLEFLSSDTEFCNTLSKKLAPPLVTLLSSEPEIQYVALRNINLIVQKRPDILKHEMKVFFVKYNDPIYVKLEKLDIMIRLASQHNIAQVLSELKEYATEVDVDFVRKAVRAIGRCAIKVEPSAERCVSTLLDLIQTKVNYVVQEAIVVIKDIFRKYPNKYEGIISTLCENLDTLDEPEARASMVWIIGEYAERIDNADELLDSFLEGFHDENSQVQLQLLTAVVKLFLKRPVDTQELVQHVLSLATQDSDNPDLRDRGFIYWRLLSTDPAAAKEVVLADKPLISEETDLLEPTLLDELICHISSLASVYHKPPSAFVEGRGIGLRRTLPTKSEAPAEDSMVIPNQESLIGDLLSMDIGSPVITNTIPKVDLIGSGLDSLLSGPPVENNSVGILGEIFGIDSVASNCFSFPKIVWLPADKGKGLEICGTFIRKAGQIFMDMSFSNKAMQMTGFAIQLNKNSFGLTPGAPLNAPPALQPGQSNNVSLQLITTGQVQRMEPLNNLQVAVKNNIDIFYFACLIHSNVLFCEDGQLEKRIFLQTWKEIPSANEVQYTLKEILESADLLATKLAANNIFTIAKRNVDGQDMLYQSLKLTNNIWVLLELKLSPGTMDATLSLKSRSVEVAPIIFTAYDSIIRTG